MTHYSAQHTHGRGRQVIGVGARIPRGQVISHSYETFVRRCTLWIGNTSCSQLLTSIMVYGIGSWFSRFINSQGRIR
jgi:hypothetical protein